jgi:hypothetical protein
MESAMRRARSRLLCGATASVLVAVLAIGCGRESDPPPVVPVAPLATEPAPDFVAEEPLPDASTAPAAPAPAVRDSAYSGESQPPALPHDVPIYPSALPISSMASPTRGTIVNLRSQDGVDLVSAWYGKELPERGWLLETQSGAANSHLVTAVKQGRKATVLITGNPSGAQILLTVLEIR